MKISEVAGHIGEEWRIDYTKPFLPDGEDGGIVRSSRVRVLAVEPVPERYYDWGGRLGIRNVRYAKCAVLHEDTGEELGIENVRPKELVEPWSDHLVRKDRRMKLAARTEKAVDALRPFFPGVKGRTGAAGAVITLDYEEALSLASTLRTVAAVEEAIR